jgi:hypothetical protein
MRNKTFADQSGLISLDFIFAILLVFGFTMVLFAVSFTLGMVEVGQYATFAASRAYNAAQATESLQSSAAKAKFNQVISGPVLSKILASGWVSLSYIASRDYSEDYNASGDSGVFVGTQVAFVAKILNIRIPMVGNTATNNSTGKATLNSYLMREPSTEECNQFNQNRYTNIITLDDSYQNARAGTVAIITDNGC